jgi:cytochrome c oxidase subunit IV
MENTHSHSNNYNIYILVWLGLVALTTLTVAVAGLDFLSLTVVVALAIATTKSLLVANYFMHVKSDSKVFKVFILVCIVIFLTMIILTFFDLIFRSPVK